jgi:transforming growth factor-beta-induced protein
MRVFLNPFGCLLRNQQHANCKSPLLTKPNYPISENQMKRTFLALAIVVAVLTSNDAQAQQKTIVETAIAAGNFNTLVTAVKAAGLVETLSGHTQFTVFAPTDEAFAKVDSATLQSLLKPENKSQLTQVLTYHVLSGRVGAKDAYDLNSAATVNGQRLSLNLRGEKPKVGDSTIVVTDIQCSNGVIHVIDAVLLPKLDNIPATATAAGQFNTLLAAVGAAGLGDVLSGPGPFTVFAPTDEAFASLPAGTVESLLKPENKQKLIDILKYHVVSGRVYDNDAVKAGKATTLLGRSIDVNFSAKGIKINDASVLAKNIETSNGVVHVINNVLIPTSMSGQSVMNSLTAAIDRGVPMFNAGQHGKCCDLYMETMTSINSAGIKNADRHTITMVNKALENARNTQNMSERAWVLRRGMDELYTRVSKMPMSTQTSR